VKCFGYLFSAGLGTGYTQEAKENAILIRNVKIFDGKSEKLAEGMSVLVEGNKIAKIAKSIKEPAGATVIDAKGRTLTPGFIAAHEHLVGQMPFQELMFNDTRYAGYVATWTAGIYLKNGFTTVRDVCGNAYSLKQAIDRGYIEGPRIYPSGPMISQTSGHSDHRHPSEASKLIGGEDDIIVQYGDTAIADGVPEVLKATRENLRRGASQIKIAVGGGSASESDPLEDISILTKSEENLALIVKDGKAYRNAIKHHLGRKEGIIATGSASGYWPVRRRELPRRGGRGHLLWIHETCASRSRRARRGQLNKERATR
jgi:imidazolonepropionase-like amidohydrolase